MRQAGRYMSQYRKLRRRHSILDLCHSPELAAAVTLQPVERLGVDAAIIFADILLPFEPLRLGLRFASGEGPVIDRPIRDAGDVERLPSFNVEAELGFVLDAIRLARRALPADVPLIGFAGAPFTLASYAIEGRASRTFTKTTQLMSQDPRARSATSSRARGDGPATFSISATACCPRPMSRRSGRSWTWCMAADQLAVLLMAYGGPGNLAEVEPYLLDVRGGRPTKPQLVEEIRARYARIGGRSPILEHTRAQAAGVGRALGTGFRTYVGMRHWHPYIKDSVAEIRRAGTQRVVGVVMAPHYSGMSVGAYEKKLLEAAHESEPLEVALVRSWWEQAAFLDTMANRVRQALQRFPKPSEVQVIFTAHSLPERILAAGAPYPEEIQASAAEVARRLELGEGHFAYQSGAAD